MDKIVKILLLTDFSSGYSRNLLRGIVDYAQRKKNWVFYRMPLYYRILHGDKEIIKWAKKWKVDAIIAQLSDIDLEPLKELNIPVIVQNYKDRIPGICNLTGDYIGTGKMAAEYFLKMGYRNFAYYGIQEAIWSRERYTGFKDAVGKAGFEVCEYFESTSQKESWEQDYESIGRWLQTLPEHTALFACDDYYALHIIETCRILNISVPDSIAVLGVDNDQLICNISDPSLSSIVIDSKNGGYQAGEALDELMKNNSSTIFNISVPPVQVISRGSTKKWVIRDKYILKTVEYIENNYADSISVQKLLELVPFSRRVFEKKFKEETGSSIYQFILDYRINRFAEKLLTSDSPIENIGIGCGFRNGQNISRIFTRHKGMTPSEFRKRAEFE